MHKIKIGVWDEEIEYVTRLTAFLQKQGKGKWEVMAFTESSNIQEYLRRNSLDLIVGTDREALNLFRSNTDLVKLWLTQDDKNMMSKKKDWYTLYRFQSAEVIADLVKEIVRKKQQGLEQQKKLVAVYSPIGRCGKTTLALDFVKRTTYGNWLYVGMEDYSSFGDSDVARKAEADDYFYYWKTRNQEGINGYLGNAQNVIASGNSFFDARQVDVEDMIWLRAMLEASEYNGAVFDIGSGVLQDFRLLESFDVILVPYVDEEYARKKISNFEEMFRYQQMEGYKEYLHYINMTKKNEIHQQLQHIFGGDDM